MTSGRCVSRARLAREVASEIQLLIEGDLWEQLGFVDMAGRTQDARPAACEECVRVLCGPRSRSHVRFRAVSEPRQ